MDKKAHRERLLILNLSFHSLSPAITVASNRVLRHINGRTVKAESKNIQLIVMDTIEKKGKLEGQSCAGTIHAERQIEAAMS